MNFDNEYDYQLNPNSVFQPPKIIHHPVQHTTEGFGFQDYQQEKPKVIKTI